MLHNLNKKLFSKKVNIIYLRILKNYNEQYSRYVFISKLYFQSKEQTLTLWCKSQEHLGNRTFYRMRSHQLVCTCMGSLHANSHTAMVLQNLPEQNIGQNIFTTLKSWDVPNDTPYLACIFSPGRISHAKHTFRINTIWKLRVFPVSVLAGVQRKLM